MASVTDFWVLDTNKDYIPMGSVLYVYQQRKHVRSVSGSKPDRLHKTKSIHFREISNFLVFLHMDPL